MKKNLLFSVALFASVVANAQSVSWPCTVSREGNVVTYELKNKAKNAGVYRYALRLYPKNADLPHRQDFAYVRWI